MIDYLLIVFAAAELGTIAIIAYYSYRILVIMRRGRLEKSWRYLVAGAVVSAAGVAAFITDLVSDNSTESIAGSYVGMALLVIGGIYLALGFREHYKFWFPNVPK